MNRIHQRVEIDEKLHQYEMRYGPISALAGEDARQCFIEQIIESIHRVEYVGKVKVRPISAERANPDNLTMFNPLLAAAYYQNMGNHDEACWLTFIFTYFGRSRSKHDEWRLSREFYGGLKHHLWTWAEVTSNPGALTLWLDRDIPMLSRPGASFGSHRKYTSWRYTADAVASYVAWVGASYSHKDKFDAALLSAAGNPQMAFHSLYQSMDTVYTFGRMGKFDYLAMIGKMELAPIFPGSTYLMGSTGPQQGGRLFYGDPYLTVQELDRRFLELSQVLEVGPQEIEDSICNWQKSPQQFFAYRI
jgi:Alpha-glutamyl/putrescinyl thymine pyrophosphorylase clade 3